MDPSLVSQVIKGKGLPCATQTIWEPVLLLKVTNEGGSCTKDGIWTGS